MTIRLFDAEQEVTIRPASEIFTSTVGFEWINQELYLVFSTTENRKGYGKQKVRVDELDSVMAVLSEASEDLVWAAWTLSKACLVSPRMP